MQNSLESVVHHWGQVAPLLTAPKTKEDYETLMAHLKEAMVIAEQKPNSPLSSLIKAMANAAEDYESKQYTQQLGSGLAALKYLISLHGIKQSELKEIGSQGVVSEVLNGKRSLTLRHVRELSRRFNVSPSVFIE